MKIKRLFLSALVLGLLVWGLSEFFHWFIDDLIGGEKISRIAPGLAGATLGLVISALRQKREKMLGVKTD